MRSCSSSRAAASSRPGSRVTAAELLPHLAEVKPRTFAVFAETDVKFAVGDTIRLTSGGKDATGKHRLDNGRIDTISGFTRGGGLRLSNGWELSPSFAHYQHGLVSTSHASQSKTVDIVLGAFNKASTGAMSLAQFLVTVSRGRERGMVFTDLSRDELLEALSREDRRKSAVELFDPQPVASVVERAGIAMRSFRQRVDNLWRQSRERRQAIRERLAPQKEIGYAR